MGVKFHWNEDKGGFSLVRLL